jgi:hypothetical protein
MIVQVAVPPDSPVISIKTVLSSVVAAASSFFVRFTGTNFLTSSLARLLPRAAAAICAISSSTPTGVRYLAGQGAGPGSGRGRPPSIMVLCEQPTIRRWPLATA